MSNSPPGASTRRHSWSACLNPALGTSLNSMAARTTSNWPAAKGKGCRTSRRWYVAPGRRNWVLAIRSRASDWSVTTMAAGVCPEKRRMTSGMK